MNEIRKWCMCKKVTSVAKNMVTTCAKCGGDDAYKDSKDRPRCPECKSWLEDISGVSVVCSSCDYKLMSG